MNEQQRTLSPEILVSRLGDYLVERKLITPEDLQAALAHQATLRQKGHTAPLLGQILLDMNKITRPALDTVITEQIIALRSALIESNQHLEQRVKERTAELEQALRKLSELSQLKSNFVSNISHELRTPLTHVKGYLDLLISEDLGPVNQPQVQAMQIMQRAAERLERLIEDLIQFSTAERDDVHLRMRPFSLSVLCLNILSRMQPRAKASQIELAYDLPDQLPDVTADEEKISWVLLQLLDNALKFTQPGGTITLKLEPDGKFVRASIKDTGIGIPPERIDEIFEPFHQLDSSSTRRYAGTGLGLALVRKIIEAHGSVIHVNSEVGKGSTFEFVIGTTEIAT